MSDPRPTKEQWTAIREVEKDLSVSAGAGAGKTWVLTERYTAMLAGRPMVLPPLELEAEELHREPGTPARPYQIVAITFTKEAAAEMKARIRERLNRWKRTAAPDEQRLIGQLKEEVERAAITTIHGFCSDLLRQYPIEAGVDPQFRVLEESEARMALDDVLREVLDAGLAAEDGAVIRLVTEYGYEQLVEHLGRFYQSVREQTEDFHGMAQHSLAKLNELSNGLEMDVQLLTACLARLSAIDLSQKDTSKGSAKRGAELQAAYPAIASTLEAWQASGLRYQAEVAELLSGLLNGWGVLVKELKADVNDLKAIIGRIVGQLVPGGMLDVVQDASAVLQLVHQSFTERKRQERGVDFTDLQNRAVQLLQHPVVGKAIAGRLRFLMVDEFQDTNPVQKGLLDALTASNPDLKLFVVGDAKQSIYRFRGADLEVFLATQAEVLTRDGEHVPLAHNFRTQQPVIDFVNRLFERLMPVQADGPRYATQYEPMVATRPPAHDRHMVEILHLSAAEDAAKSKLKEAQAIARRIQEMVGQELLVPGEEGLRPVQYRDVTLLFSAMTHLSYYEYALQEQGIPYYIIGSRHFFRRQEVWDLVQLLQAVVDERDVIALIGALRSPLFGVSDEALYWLGKPGLQRSQFSHSENWPRIAGDDQEKLQRAERLLAAWRSEKAFLTAGELLSRILEQTGYEQALLLTFGGNQKVGNVRKLLELAHEQAPERAGVLPFLQYLQLMVDESVDEADAQVESDQSDVVKIMTVHKSKGLEFPIVILPDMAREFNVRSEGKFRYDPAYGLVPTFTEHESWNDMGYAPKLREIDRSKAVEEERRKLYVAMTRARDYLLLVATREAPKKAMTLDNSRWFDWLVATIADGDLSKMAGTLLAEWPEVKWSSETAGDSPEPMLPTQPKKHDPTAVLTEITAAWREVAAAGAGAMEHLTNQMPPLHHAFPFTQPLQPDSTQGILLSVSALLTYLACPRQYYYRYGLRLPELTDEEPQSQPEQIMAPDERDRTQLAATERGTLVHRVLEWLQEPAEADDLIRRALAEQSIVGQEAEQHLPALRADVNTYLQSPLFREVQSAAETKSELMFRLTLGPHEITGVLDKVIRKADDTAVVIDYKTNRITQRSIQKTTEHYTPQLQLYTLVAKHLLNWNVARSVLYFTALGTESQVPIQDTDLKKTEETIRQALDHIATHDREADYTQATSDSPCRHCGYLLLCKGVPSLSDEAPATEQLTLF
ncbi:hypothetical protein CBW65_11730 [Tumebacillus avium]|uniref:DNA 3'-5' helicase n=1 Tax=Tumebacillus avium TaxID=1903704 RepID=A0A1Y0IM74_9BACL|nr:UvrD-helicase domain-containing protein [Tumebacillus avium]ARU61607.1 hypothetical protein CBW65_11730 [Tumebacillus avium]